MLFFVKHYHHFPIFFQYLVEDRFIFITSWQRRFIDPTRFAQTSTGMEYQVSLIFSHNSCLFFDLKLPILFLRTTQRCSMGFKSGDWDGLIITGTWFCCNHDLTLLGECLGSLSCILKAFHPQQMEAFYSGEFLSSQLHSYFPESKLLDQPQRPKNIPIAL